MSDGAIRHSSPHPPEQANKHKCGGCRLQSELDRLRTSADFDEAWHEAEAATTVQYQSALGDLIDRKRYDLSVHRLYATRLDAAGNEEYEYEARLTLPGIHYLAKSGSTPAAALRALAARLAPDAP